MRVRAGLLAIALAVPALAAAQQAEVRVITATELAPGASLRPPARPGGTPVPSAGSGADAGVAAAATAQPQSPNRRPGILGGLFRPRQNGGGLGAVNAAPTVVAGGGTALAVASSLRPTLRPDGLESRVRAAATRNTPSTVTRPGQSSGQLCGVVGLQGDVIEPVTGRISGCGIQNAVRLRVVHGVQLTTPATINCVTAQSISQWVLDADDIIGNTGGGMANLRVLASYACRTRNSQRGARLSEHSTGNAIDIGGIGLQNGSELSVLSDWRSGNSGIMRSLHEAACGTFGTVLGPESDRFHQDHFHFDVASYRSGAYCR
ncbi:extensin family protein [Gymnodinialimonas hymeniacidonis]|uniref:extensin-like domain-containing protein n=1 Tax=Gymnodinialimonas hymeniacidonis TaxID=3126508 RepID=UPI0034C69C82